MCQQALPSSRVNFLASALQVHPRNAYPFPDTEHELDTEEQEHRDMLARVMWRSTQEHPLSDRDRDDLVELGMMGPSVMDDLAGLWDGDEALEEDEGDGGSESGSDGDDDEDEGEEGEEEGEKGEEAREEEPERKEDDDEGDAYTEFIYLGETAPREDNNGQRGPAEEFPWMTPDDLHACWHDTRRTVINLPASTDEEKISHPSASSTHELSEYWVHFWIFLGVTTSFGLMGCW